MAPHHISSEYELGQHHSARTSMIRAALGAASLVAVLGGGVASQAYANPPAIHAEAPYQGGDIAELVTQPRTISYMGIDTFNVNRDTFTITRANGTSGTGNPMDEFPITLDRLATIPLPGGIQAPDWGFFTAAAGNANHPTEANTFYIGTTSGRALRYDITLIDELAPANNEELAAIGTGKVNLTGLTRTPDGYAISRQGVNLLYSGTILDDTWSDTGSITVQDFGIASMNDLTWYRGHFGAVTDEAEFIKIAPDGTYVASPLGGSFDTVTALQLTGYTHDLFSSGQQSEGHKAMTDGLPSGTSQNITYNPDINFGVVGVAHVGSGETARTVVVTRAIAYVYTALPHADFIEAIEEACEPLPKFDFDQDCDIDGADMDAMVECVKGPTFDYTTTNPECADGDADVDNDVDMMDFAAFQIIYAEHNGPQ